MGDSRLPITVSTDASLQGNTHSYAKKALLLVSLIIKFYKHLCGWISRCNQTINLSLVSWSTGRASLQWQVDAFNGDHWPWVTTDWTTRQAPASATMRTDRQMDITDPVLSQVRRFKLWGKVNPTTHHKNCCHHRYDGLSLQQDMLFWGTRVIIPPKERDTLLLELPNSHIEIVKVKALARICGGFGWTQSDTYIIDGTSLERLQRMSKIASSHPYRITSVGVVWSCSHRLRWNFWESHVVSTRYLLMYRFATSSLTGTYRVISNHNTYANQTSTHCPLNGSITPLYQTMGLVSWGRSLSNSAAQMVSNMWDAHLSTLIHVYVGPTLAQCMQLRWDNVACQRWTNIVLLNGPMVTHP